MHLPTPYSRITFSAFRYRNNQRGLSLRAGHVAPVSWFINGAGWHGGEITVANDSNRPRRSLVENPGMKNESRRGGIKLPETRCSPVPTYQREHASPGQLINDPYPLWIFIRRGVNERQDDTGGTWWLAFGGATLKYLLRRGQEIDNYSEDHNFSEN